MYCKHLFLYM